MPQSGSQEPLCGNALGRSPKEVTHNWRTSDAQGHANFPSVNVILFKLVYTAVEVPENVYIYVGSHLTGFNPKHVDTTTRAVSRWSSMRPLYQFMFSHHSGSWVDTLRSFLWDGSQHQPGHVGCVWREQVAYGSKLGILKQQSKRKTSNTSRLNGFKKKPRKGKNYTRFQPKRGHALLPQKSA